MNSGRSARAFRPLPGKTGARDHEPSYDLGSRFLGERYARAEELVADVPGWPRPEDALKLYELAYRAEGSILEIGTHRWQVGDVDGARPARCGLVSTDRLNRCRCSRAARRGDDGSGKGVPDRLLLVRASAGAFFAANPSFSPSLVFLDADHSYEGVRRDLELLEPRVPRGGLVLLHVYLDPRNDDPASAEIGVCRATQESQPVQESPRACWARSSRRALAQSKSCTRGSASSPSTILAPDG
jgi:hypothetical protein